MHSEAWDWIARFGTDDEIDVLDIGGRYVTHDPRELFPNANYTVLDILDDVGVDIVADAATWTSDKRWSVVLAAEVFEHTRHWREICTTVWNVLNYEGAFIVTTAAPGRPAHSAIDGQALRDGEYYKNIDPGELQNALYGARFSTVIIDELPKTCDVRAVAIK